MGRAAELGADRSWVIVALGGPWLCAAYVAGNLNCSLYANVTPTIIESFISTVGSEVSTMYSRIEAIS